MNPIDAIDVELSKVERSGINELRKFLVDSDFSTAPCSTVFHLACEGGLALHTLNVYKAASRINKLYDSVCIYDSITIAAICHDLCKINFYIETDETPTEPQMRYLTSLMTKAKLPFPSKLNKTYAGILIDFMLHTWTKGITLPPYARNYEVKDQLPIGHGEKSLYLASQFIKLTPEEAAAIRWHMATFDAGIHFDYPSGYPYREAVKQFKLVSIIQLADIEATQLMEV